MEIYLGNLPYETDEQTVRDTFAEYGTVDRVNIIYDRETGRSKGFGFVSMPNDPEAQNAIDALDDTPLNGRQIKVNQAKPRVERNRGYEGDR